MPESTELHSHPSPKFLALYANGDLPLLKQWQVRHHIWGCTRCDEEVSHLQAALVELRREASTSTLTAFEAVVDWSRLEREMLGNIAVGVAAARCIENVGTHRWFSRGALVAGILALVFMAGWFTHIPPEQNRHLVSALRRIVGLPDPQSGTPLVQTTQEGIAVRTQGATLTLLHPRSAVVSLSGNSAVTARYVDERTGQMTITKVYGE